MLQQGHLEKLSDTKSRKMGTSLAAYLAAVWRGGCQGHVVVAIWPRDLLRGEHLMLCYYAIPLLDSPFLRNARR